MEPAGPTKAETRHILLTLDDDQKITQQALQVFALLAQCRDGLLEELRRNHRLDQRAPRIGQPQMNAAPIPRIRQLADQPPPSSTLSDCDTVPLVKPRYSVTPSGVSE